MKNILGFVDRIMLSRKISKCNDLAKRSQYPKYRLYEERAKCVSYLSRCIGFRRDDANTELYNGMVGDVITPYDSCYDLLKDIATILTELNEFRSVDKSTLTNTANSTPKPTRDFFTVNGYFAGMSFVDIVLSSMLEASDTIRNIEKNYSSYLPVLSNTIDILNKRMDYLWLVFMIPTSVLRNVTVKELGEIYGKGI